MTGVSADAHLEELVETITIGMMNSMSDRSFSRQTPGGAC